LREAYFSGPDVTIIALGNSDSNSPITAILMHKLAGIAFDMPYPIRRLTELSHAAGKVCQGHFYVPPLPATWKRLSSSIRPGVSTHMNMHSAATARSSRYGVMSSKNGSGAEGMFFDSKTFPSRSSTHTYIERACKSTPQ
jgi:hypothetical protein